MYVYVRFPCPVHLGSGAGALLTGCLPYWDPFGSDAAPSDLELRCLTASRDAEPAVGRERARQVRTIFGEIAPRYDLLNRVLSLRIDRKWRQRAIRELAWDREPGGLYLDACAGTLDLALELAGQPGFGGRVVGADFALPMLEQGRSKIRSAPVFPTCGDTQRLPFPDAVFAGATVGFGARNLSDLATGCRELHRVLAPEGRLVVLDFTVPIGRLFRVAYLLYFNRILPTVGRVVSGHPWAYSYLPKSVRQFPPPEDLAELLCDVGFTSVGWFRLTAGIAAIHVASKGAAPEAEGVLPKP